MLKTDDGQNIDTSQEISDEKLQSVGCIVQDEHAMKYIWPVYISNLLHNKPGNIANKDPSISAS